MTGKTVSGSYTTGITLTVGTYNPVLVTGVIDVATGQALIGAGGYAWTILNQGTIASADSSMFSTGAGISLTAGGTVSNTASALISGYVAVVVAGAAGTVTNYGTIAVSGGFGTGVVLQKGGFVSNAVGGTIIGGGVGIETFGVTTVINQGAIDAPNALVGVSLHKGGLLSDSSTGVITGTQFGAYFTNGSGTIVNAGTIGLVGTDTLGAHVGIGFAAGFAGLLVDEPGAVFIGKVNGGNTIGGTAISTLELSSAATRGTLSGLGSQFVNFARIDVDSGAGWTLNGTNSIAAGVTVTDLGQLIAAGSLVNAGTIEGRVVLAGGVNVSNAAGGVVTGYGGALYAPVGTAVTVVNAGSIGMTGTAGAAIGMLGTGIVTNFAGATISAVGGGIDIGGAAGTVLNQGSIAAGVGIVLRAGGQVSNAATGTISGTTFGVYVAAGGAVINDGNIAGATNAGVALSNDGTVINTKGAVITGHYSAIGFSATAGTVINDGTVLNSAGAGVVIAVGGVVTNQQDGTISSHDGAIEMSTAAGTVVNFGGIAAANNVAVGLGAGGLVSNAAGGTIIGYGGVGISGAAGTVINAGSIGASGNVAVRLGAGFANRLVIDPGAGFTGKVDGGNTIGATASSALELASGASGGTFAGFGTQFVDFSQVAIDAGAHWSFASTNTVATGITLTNSGTISGADVTLAAGAALVNAKGATIIRDDSPVGPNAAVFGLAGASAHYVSNAGVIDNQIGTSAGVALFSAGTIDNAGSGTISGGYTGIYTTGDTSVVVNSGRISGDKSNGLDLKGAVVVTNNLGGTITSPQNGVEAETGGGPLTLVNDGLIGGTGGIGVFIGAGGMVTNLASGTIVGGTVGLRLDVASPGASVINQGLIRETAAGDYFGVLLNAPSAVTLTNVGTIESNGGKAVGFRAGYTNRLIVGPGAVFVGGMNGGNPIGTVGAQSVLELASGSSVGTVGGIGSQFFNFGSIVLDPGSQWEITGNTSDLAGTISGFAFGDTIELTGVTATGSSFVNGVLTISEAVGFATLNLTGSFTTGDFVMKSESGNTDITLACFAAGTRIRTERGAVAVERLRVGEGVVTQSGAARPIVWIGHRRLDLRRHPAAHLASPALILAHAFGRGLPGRDLRLSPDHAVFVDGVLIPVKYLVNGSTILRQGGMRVVSYFHVELDRHDILLAEDLPVESYLDTGGRAMFENGGLPLLLHPDFAIRAWDAGGCARLVVAGPELQAVRERLSARAAELGRAVG